MELGMREAVQFFSIIATLAGAFAVVKSQLSRVIEDLDKITREMEKVNERLDASEQGMAVFKHQVNTLAGILSPTNLERRNREMASMEKELSYLREASDRMYKTHNGRHLPVPNKIEAK
tara:strand:+ start:3516 stop:3872 length:357 start_codon:yes stop_codon:yes gene_type:complete